LVDAILNSLIAGSKIPKIDYAALSTQLTYIFYILKISDMFSIDFDPETEKTLRR